jgi:hypothetical protein
MLASMQQHPPFRLAANLDPQTTGAAIAHSIAYFSSIDAPLRTAFSSAMQAIALTSADPLYQAGLALSRDIDAGVGAGNGNGYHNRLHFREVLLCTVAITELAELPAHQRALLYVAAVAHDFHHDGQPNREPYRLEKLAVEKMQPYLIEAGVAAQDRQTLAALILATETASGVGFARACYDAHFVTGTGVRIAPPLSELALLQQQSTLARMAIILCEADVLPSVGLTVNHAELTATRLEAEWGTTLDANSKIEFIDHFVGDLRVARYFMPNVEEVRKAFENQACSD